MSIPCERSQCITAVPVVPAVLSDRLHLDGLLGSWAVHPLAEAGRESFSGHGSDVRPVSVVLGHMGTGYVDACPIVTHCRDDDGDNVVLSCGPQPSDTAHSSRHHDRGLPSHVLAVNQDVCQIGGSPTLPGEMSPCRQREGQSTLHNGLPSCDGIGDPFPGSRIMDAPSVPEDVIEHDGTSHVPAYPIGCDVHDIGMENGDGQRTRFEPCPTPVIPATASIILRRCGGGPAMPCNNLYKVQRRNVK